MSDDLRIVIGRNTPAHGGSKATVHEVDTNANRYLGVSYAATDEGYVIWRAGTGMNVEVLFLKVRDGSRRKGVATALLRTMLETFLLGPTAQLPYHTVYGFCRDSNEDAKAFYTSAGFDLTRVAGVYADGVAVVFSAPFKRLVGKLVPTHLQPKD